MLGCFLFQTKVPIVKLIVQYHADCILPNAQLASYGYNQIDNIIYAGRLRDRFQKGLGGTVKFDQSNDDKFFDANRALLCRCITSFLIFSVPWIQAERFRKYWHQPAQKYNRFSNNCSSVPYAALYEAGIYPKNLVSPVTPQRLYNHLKGYFKEKAHAQIIEGYGFLGIDFQNRKLEIRIPKELGRLRS